MQCPACHNQTDPDQRFCRHCGGLMPADAPADPLVGTTLGGKYRIVKLLGEGGMGAVYHGEQQMGTTVRKVAIKTLHKHLSLDPKIRARFQRECGTMAGLEHPNTIQVFDFGMAEDGEHLFIVMEFVQGKNIADLLEQNGPMPPARVEHVVKQVCGSLAEAHSNGIVHRDLKPENIVLTDRAGQKDFVKVLDFGIAKRSGEEDKNEQKLTQQGMVLGTPPYMSPEQFTGKPIDARSDIYSLAVMAYEMLTGRLPFHADTAWEWATQHMTVPPTPIEQQPNGAAVPDSMRHAIARGLAKRVDERFSTVDEFLTAFSSGAPTGYTAHLPQQGTAQMPQRSSVLSGNIPHVESGATRARTEAGIPSMTAPGFEAQPQPSHPGMQGGGYTPPAGNQAYSQQPQGGGYQQQPYQQPPQKQGGGAGKFIVIGLIALLVVGALAVGGVVLATRDGGTPKPIASNAASTSSSASPPSEDASVGEDAGAIDPDEPKDAEVPLDSAPIKPDAGRPPPRVFDAGVRPPPPPLPRACIQAAAMRNAKRMKEYESLAAKCVALGGKVP